MADVREASPGGSLTTAFLLSRLELTQPAPGLSPEERSIFSFGDARFSQAWVTAPSSTTGLDGLGPLFNAVACDSCHVNNGRGRPPDSPLGAVGSTLVRIALPNGQVSEVYGSQIQPSSIVGVTSEGEIQVTFEEVDHTMSNGSVHTLLQPRLNAAYLRQGPLEEVAQLSVRTAQPVVGLGLLEAIPEQRLRDLADPDDLDGDGIRGQLGTAVDAVSGTTVVGRFGWKAEQPTVRQQSAAAFLGDMGITTPEFPEQNCTAAQSDCASQPHGGEPEAEERAIAAVASYLRNLAIPVREQWDDAQVLQGQALFFEAGCDTCHTPSHVTSPDALPSRLANQTIWPYSDLLLHDMGPDLADTNVRGETTDHTGLASLWRTPPLWTIGRTSSINRHTRFLHDGRARSFEEAILWHGGEGALSREAFVQMNEEQKKLLIGFLESL